MFDIIDLRIKFYQSNSSLLPRKHSMNLRHLKKGLQEFHSKYVLAPADKASNNIIVI